MISTILLQKYKITDHSMDAKWCRRSSRRKTRTTQL